MSNSQMKTPPPDGELLDDWEQMADSGVSSNGDSFATALVANFTYTFCSLASGQKTSKYKDTIT